MKRTEVYFITMPTIAALAEHFIWMLYIERGERAADTLKISLETVSDIQISTR